MALRTRPLPRVIRLRDAPNYLGMDPNRFNAEVRPFVTEVRIGTQGVAFDRLELDAWWENYKLRNGRRPREDKRTLSTSTDGVDDYTRVAEQILQSKRNRSRP